MNPTNTKAHIFSLLEHFTRLMERCCHLLALLLTQFAVWVAQARHHACGCQRPMHSYRRLTASFLLQFT